MGSLNFPKANNSTCDTFVCLLLLQYFFLSSFHFYLCVCGSWTGTQININFKKKTYDLIKIDLVGELRLMVQNNKVYKQIHKNIVFTTHGGPTCAIQNLQRFCRRNLAISISTIDVVFCVKILW